MISKTAIPAVLDEELRQFLADIDEIQRIEEGKAACMICGDTVTVETIRLVVPLKNRVGYVDDRRECLMQFTTAFKEENASRSS